MARRSMTVYLNGLEEKNRVRTFGGNGSEVRIMAHIYKNMTKEQFLIEHPKFEEQCREKFKLFVFYD